MAIENYGSYQLIKRLATGGMAQIYLARQKGPENGEKLLVVKRILPHLAENADFVRMFLDEARIAARLNHPNIVQIFNLGSQEDSFFIAMEFIHGEDVRRIWKRSEQVDQPLPIQLVCRIIMDACAGLDYAHKKTDSQTGRPLEIVHRDVSPQNILVTFDGTVKVVDFGIAKAVDQATVTRSGVLKGKYSYMSPEQAAGKRVDCRSDIFALGVLLYELLTGQRLFKRANDIQTLHAVTECEVTPPSVASSRVPRDLDAIVMKALAKDPADRYQEAVHLQLALEDWLIQRKLPSSSAHLAAFMEDLYAERLAEERRAGQVLVGDELDSAPRQQSPSSEVPPPPHQSQSNPSFSIGRQRSSSVDGRLPSPVERLTERSMPAARSDDREATTAQRGPRRSSSPDGVFRELIKSATAAQLNTPPPANPVDTLIGHITDPVRTPSQEDQPLTEPLPRHRKRGAPEAVKGEDTIASPTQSEDNGATFSASATERSGAPLSRRSRIPPAVLAILASSLVAGAFAGYMILGARAQPAKAAVLEPDYAAVHVESEPAGATVLFDGKPADPTPCTLPRVPAGTYKLVVGKAGFRDYSQDVEVPASGQLQVPPIRLEPESPAPSTAGDAGAGGAHHKVALTIVADPDASLYVDDVPRGKTPVTLEGEPGAEVELRLERAGYRTLSRRVAFGQEPREEPMKLAAVRPPPPPKPVRTAKVRFAVTPWADEVQCGSRNLGNTPFADVDMPVGTHQCRVYNKTYAPKMVTVEVKPNILNKVLVKF